jgi:tetratricopeptide (TPR) repeat protein
MKPVVIMWFLALAATAQVPGPASVSDAPADPAYASLTRAFDELRLRHYDPAILSFRAASALSPQRADIRRNLAYTLLKTGDSDGAREEFGQAMRADPGDFHTALEYAFLCYEATADAPARKAEARRIFAAVRDAAASDTESRATASAAFLNIDEPLRAGIERWQQVLNKDAPPNFSVYYELAHLAEERDQTDLAATNYKAAFRSLPARKSVLLELARVEKARGNQEGMMAALIAASRGPEPRASEMAREQLPARYPWVYEFRQALELDPGNEALHRELAYLLLKMSETGQSSRGETEKEFAALIATAKDDLVSAAQLGFLYLADERPDLAMPLLNRVLASGDEATANRVRMALHLPLILAERRDATVQADQRAIDPRVLAERSYQAGFLKDALRYYIQAREDNPLDSSLALKLGWTNNMLHDDATALRWFNVAKQSGDPAVAAEAKRAWSNLRPEQRKFRTTVWLYPLFSSRWGDLFGYGQVKSEVKVTNLHAHPYASVRLAGDVRRSTSGPLPQSLSESAFITALGVATDTWRGAAVWFEAGIATSYLNGTHWSDYRGGIAYTKTRGASLASERRGWFLETNGDSVYISHFSGDLINYAQTRAGYMRPLAGVATQVFWHQNFTFDAKRQYWANFVEMGPGIRIHPPGLPAPVWITVSAIHGVYLLNAGNPGRPNFNDFRVGIWYAFTK